MIKGTIAPRSDQDKRGGRWYNRGRGSSVGVHCGVGVVCSGCSICVVGIGMRRYDTPLRQTERERERE